MTPYISIFYGLKISHRSGMEGVPNSEYFRENDRIENMVADEEKITYIVEGDYEYADLYLAHMNTLEVGKHGLYEFPDEVMTFQPHIELYDKDLREFCEKNNIHYRQPRWFATVTS